MSEGLISRELKKPHPRDGLLVASSGNSATECWSLVVPGLVPPIHAFLAEIPPTRGCPASQTSLRSLRKSRLLWPGMTKGRKDKMATPLRLGEVQLHTDPVGIVKEELRVAGARHDALAEFHVPGLQAPAHTVDIGRGKGDVVEAAGVLVLFP